MTIEQFLASYPSHPLTAALNVMEASKTAEELARYQAFCTGMAFLMKSYGEISEEEYRALSNDIKGKGVTLQ
ncbi:hypothetical protein [Vreelandella massiliensis]|uniref:hypothetical protein n=1 Tax=Vreelandella massiliensis TaxID=1816686 RepID=UPI00096A542F|nr:hypothetical protein [Halomonas massiliensis]